ncbi:MAG: DUF4381 family protein [Desulfobacterales bacterium]
MLRKTHVFGILPTMVIAVVFLWSGLGGSVTAPPGPVHPVPSAPSPALQMQPDGQPGQAVEMTDIHDIKPPEPLGANPAIIIYILLGVLVLALLTGILIYWRRRQKPSAEDPLPVLPPEDIAFGALDRLANTREIQARVFYFELSAILRSYIQARYVINAMEMTSEEFIPAIDHLAIDRIHQQNLKALVRSTDPVKFAGHAAGDVQMRDDLDFVRQLVEQTTPVEEHV